MIKIYFFSKKYLVNKKNSLIFASLKLKTIYMMNNEDLKNGDIITLIDEYDEIRIVIVNKVKESLTGKTMLYTLADLNTEDELFLEKYDSDFSYCLNDCVIRPAEDEEKIKLYDALYKNFTEDFDIKWQRHFTDSSYFDIEDYLLDVFCINYKGDDNDLIIYPDFIYEIQKYIWDKCCEAMGYPKDTDEEYQEKMVSLDNVIKWLKQNTNWDLEYDEYGRNDNYGKIDKFIKAMEE